LQTQEISSPDYRNPKMPKYSNSDIERVKAADIRRFITGADPTKAKQSIVCPFCGKKKMYVIHDGRDKNFAYCFSCQESFSNPIKAVMYYSGLDWVKAVERVAIESGIILSGQ
jgi:DNA primase